MYYAYDLTGKRND